MKPPTVLTGETFERIAVEGERLVLVLVHPTINGVDLDSMREYEFDRLTSVIDFMTMVQEVAAEFVDVLDVATIDYEQHLDALQRHLGGLPQPRALLKHYEARAVMFFASWLHHEELDYCNLSRRSFRRWLLGLLVGMGARGAKTDQDLALGLAFRLAQDPKVLSSDACWDDQHIREQALRCAVKHLNAMRKEWEPWRAERG